MPTTFRPGEHGFGFPNGFEDDFVKLPGGKHAFKTRGRCGGMAFLALDHWHHGRPIPGGNALPDDKTPLAKLIQKRLFDSFTLNGAKYLEFSLMPDHPKLGILKGAARTTREKEFPKVKRSIDAGKPCAIGICRSTSPLEMGQDHQVVCYGYEEGPAQSALLIYDNNHPRQEHRLTFATKYEKNGDMAVRHSDGSKWRAFFFETYKPEVPPAGL